jgi:hypothetical protein
MDRAAAVMGLLEILAPPQSATTEAAPPSPARFLHRRCVSSRERPGWRLSARLAEEAGAHVVEPGVLWTDERRVVATGIHRQRQHIPAPSGVVTHHSEAVSRAQAKWKRWRTTSSVNDASGTQCGRPFPDGTSFMVRTATGHTSSMPRTSKTSVTTTTIAPRWSPPPAGPT